MFYRSTYSSYPIKDGVLRDCFYNENIKICLYGDRTYDIKKNTKTPIINGDYIHPTELIYYSYDQYKKYFMDKLIEIADIKQLSYNKLNCFEESITYCSNKLRDLLDNADDTINLKKTYDIVHELEHDGEISYIVCIEYSYIRMIFHLDIKTFTKWKLMNG